MLLGARTAMFSDSYSPYLSGGGYDLGGNYRGHTAMELAYASPYSAYDSSIQGAYYPSASDYYGSYNSLSSWEEQLRYQHISQAERMSRWQERLAFESLAEQERSMMWRNMAQEQRMRLGLAVDSYWGSRYGGLGHMDSWTSSSGISPWSSSRLPLGSTLSSRYSPLWGGYSQYSSPEYSYGSLGYGGSGGMLMGNPYHRRSSLSGSLSGSSVASSFAASASASALANNIEHAQMARVSRHEARMLRQQLRHQRRMSRAASGIYAY